MSFSSSILYAFRIIFSKKTKGESSNGKRTLLGAMICIGISLVPLTALLCVSDGMISGITGRMIHLSTHDIQVTLDSRSVETSSYEEFMKSAQKIASVEKIVSVYPEVQSSALAAGSSYRTGAVVRGVSPDSFTKDDEFSRFFKIVEGSADLSDSKNAVIGEKIAGLLHVHPGDKINLISVNNVKKRIVPKVSSFTVSGIISSGYQELDALWVFIPLKSAFTSIARSSSSFYIGVSTGDSFSPELPEIESRLQAFLFSPEGIRNAYALRWDLVNESQYENFSSTKALLLLVVVLIVLVASINISSALIMIVMERRKEIAILKSCGASGKGIGFSFLTVGAFAGFGGIITGVPLGLLCGININSILHFFELIINFFARLIFILSRNSVSSFRKIKILDPSFYLTEIPISIPWKEIIVVAVGTLIISVIAALIPAVRAGKEKPIETLRKM